MSMAASAFILLGVATGRAQAQSVAISVDATAPGAPIPRIWDFHGFDEANYSTSAEGRALLDTLGQIDPTPPHVRMHFLLNTGNGTPALKWGSTNVYTEDGAGNPVYSWTITDQIMDAVTGCGGLSFTEIAFMPQALSPHPTPYQNTGTYASDSGSFYPPNDYAKWGDLIKTWAGHLNSRYPDVGQSWLWELWNEPDLSYFHGTAAEYEKLYDYTEAALHQAIPTARLGGPAVADAGSSLLSGFLQHCANGTNAVTGKTGTRLDLVSFHAKGGAAIVSGHVEMNMGHQLSLHRTGFSAVAKVPALAQLPIYVSEADPDGCAACPVSSTPADAYRLHPAYGAYVIEMSKRTLELASSMGVNIGGLITWAFTFPGTPYFAGYRALGSNGIELPVLGAFRLLGGLNGARLPVTSSGAATLASILASSVRGVADVDGMATLDGDQVQILVWNYHDDLVTAAQATVELTVKLPANFGPMVTMTHLRVDEQHGDAYTVWTSQGSPKTPSAAQIQGMQAGMLPAVLGAPQSIPVADGTATISFTLPRFGMSLLTLSSPLATLDGGVSGGAGQGGISGGSSSIGTSGGSSSTGTSGASGGTGTSGASGGSGCSCALGSGADADAWATMLWLALGSVATLATRRRRRAASAPCGGFERADA
jgi:xylan 1,4-beta-xylosidase